jgi:hypothetical protein
MKGISKLGLAALAASGCMLTTTLAAAQQAEGEVGLALPGAAPAPAAAAQGESDHDMMIGTFALGYMGAHQVPFPQGTISAPTIGIRYWIDQSLGLDLGLGFSNTGGSDTVSAGGQSQTTDLPATTAVIVHGGVPLSLASEGHFSFQIVPELNIGFATQTEEPPGGQTKIERTGILISVGARAGGEVHFGFMGIPQLSLQAGVGVLFESTQNTTKTTTAGVESKNESSRTSFRTTVNNSPWDIFTSNVAALYYF